MAVTISGSTPTFSAATGYAGGVVTSGTAQASTSGTSIDFTSIPSWVKRITVMFNGVSTNGASSLQVQIGAGSVTTTGYNAAYVTFNGSALAAGNVSTGFPIIAYAAGTNSGVLTISLLGSNTWCASGSLSLSATNIFNGSAGSVTLSGTLDCVRVTTINGTDVFDAGTINILYE